MKLYDKNGYLNMGYILHRPETFIFVVGGRGIGKTYGAIKHCMIYNKKFLFLRRTQTQVEIINKPQFCPAKSVCADIGFDMVTKPISKNSAGWFELINGDPAEKPFAYTTALSTISNLRGFDASEIDIIIYDEFIPEKQEHPIKNEFDAFCNMYETVNRNRELQGKPPVKVLCLANSNSLTNPLFIGLGLVNRADKMRNTGEQLFSDDKRGILVVMPSQSPISASKKDTALYRLTAGTDFAGMAVNNEFTADKPSRLGQMPLREYNPLCTIGEITVYQHKSRDEYYITTHRTGNPRTFTTTPADLARAKLYYGFLWFCYVDNEIVFETYICESLLTKYFGWGIL